MSRNRYTKLIRKEQCAQLARQEKELVALRRSLRRPVIDAVVTPATETKQRRRVRLERRKQDKPARYTAPADQTASAQRGPVSIEVAA